MDVDEPMDKWIVGDPVGQKLLKAVLKSYMTNLLFHWGLDNLVDDVQIQQDTFSFVYGYYDDTEDELAMALLKKGEGESGAKLTKLGRFIYAVLVDTRSRVYQTDVSVWIHFNVGKPKLKTKKEIDYIRSMKSYITESRVLNIAPWSDEWIYLIPSINILENDVKGWKSLISETGDSNTGEHSDVKDKGLSVANKVLDHLFVSDFGNEEFTHYGRDPLRRLMNENQIMPPPLSAHSDSEEEGDDVGVSLHASTYYSLFIYPEGRKEFGYLVISRGDRLDDATMVIAVPFRMEIKFDNIRLQEQHRGKGFIFDDDD